jgi:hypothetical protein
VYPKRLYRLCNNLELKQKKIYQAVPQELRDNLDSYLNNSYKTSRDKKQFPIGSPFNKDMYLKAFCQNLIDFSESFELVKISNN